MGQNICTGNIIEQGFGILFANRLSDEGIMLPFGNNVAKRVFSDKLARTSAWLSIGFLVSGLFNYGFQVAMGRLLLPTEFGFLNVLLGVFVVLSVPVGTLLMVVARQTAEYRANNDLAKVRGLFISTNRFVLKYGLIGFVLFVLASGYIAQYLRAPSVAPVFLLGLGLLAAIATPVNTAILQGLQDFKWLGFIQGLTGPIRFFFCVLMVVMGFGVNGVLFGLLAGSISLWILAYLPLRRHLPSMPDATVFGAISFRQCFAVFLANFAFTVITQLDIILVNRHFPANVSSMYIAAAVLGRTVMYIPGTIALAMFPMISEKQAQNSDSRPLLHKAVMLTLLLSGSSALLFFLAPEWILATFFGARYLGAAVILKYYGLAMLPMALLLVLFNYMMACGKPGFSYFLLLGAMLELFLINFYHYSLLWVVFFIALSSFVLVVVGFLQIQFVRAPSGDQVKASA